MKPLPIRIPLAPTPYTPMTWPFFSLGARSWTTVWVMDMAARFAMPPMTSSGAAMR